MIDRLIETLTVRDIDARLLAMHTAFIDAMTTMRLDDADTAYAELDRLLEMRLKAVRQRKVEE